ncbi:hypothetical protein ALNOE001_08100 [Candidatus Methanobinarius endosymbioticus]|uniref:Transcriptional regulator TetR C-terminal Firmicutes type domain-containing protein n=1 Tax=Candidatus Methanobinarius endosymbioticus TaxID=2006182 RepID=A0A366MBI1_9EURY|nr:hypothetical protein ALNOE001_08100 [Candidatus Methanobinarius endosymbioticus]
MLELYLKTEIDEYNKILKENKGSLNEKLKFVFYYHVGKDYNKEKNIFINKSNQTIDYREYYLFLIDIYHQHPEIREYFHNINKEMLNFYKELVNESIKKQEVRSDIDPNEVALYIFTIFKGFIEIWTGFPDIPFRYNYKY